MKTVAWLILPVVFALSACGGGGSGGSETGVAPPTYATLSGLTSATTFATVATLFNFYRPNTPEPIYSVLGATVSLTYNPAGQTYALTGTPTGSTTPVSQTFGPADLDASDGVYSQFNTSPDGTTAGGSLDIYFPTPTQPASYNIYSGTGEWGNGSSSSSTGIQNFDTYTFAYGIGTQAGDLPRSGTATYPLELNGQGPLLIAGNGTLTVDFAAGTANLTITPELESPGDDGTVLSPLATLTGSGTVDFTANGFSIDVTASNYSGTVKGLFYGPQGAEVGAALTVTQIANPGGGLLAAAALGKKQ